MRRRSRWAAGAVVLAALFAGAVAWHDGHSGQAEEQVDRAAIAAEVDAALAAAGPHRSPAVPVLVSMNGAGDRPLTADCLYVWKPADGTAPDYPDAVAALRARGWHEGKHTTGAGSEVVTLDRAGWSLTVNHHLPAAGLTDFLSVIATRTRC